MRRAAPSLPVTATMLRHFAVIAVVITSGLAMFASGEGQEILTEQVKQRESKTQAIRADRQRAAQRTVVVDGLRLAPGTRLGAADVESTRTDYSGSSGVMEQPAVAYRPPAANGLPGPAGPGLDGIARDANGAVIPPPGGQMRLRGKPGQPQSPKAARRPSQQDVDAIIAASAMRAGGNSSE